MKKLLAIIMALAIVFGLCACGGGGGNDDKYGQDGKVTISVGIPSNAKVISFEDNALTKWLEEQTGYKLKFVEYSGGTDIATQISSTIAAGMDLPDILWGIDIDKGSVETYGKEGYFVNLKEYYDDKEGASKNFWSRMEECLTEQQQEYILRKLVDPSDGAIYGVPTVETSLVDTTDYMVWINTQWLDKLGLEKPTNTDELYNVLVAFRDKDPNGNGKKDEIPLFGSQKGGLSSQVINWLINLFVYYNDNHTWQDYDGDGQLDLVYIQDAYREALKFVNKLYKEKLITSMVYTASSSEMKSIITPASGEAQCGIFVGHLTLHTTVNNEVLYQYESLKTWGCATEGDLNYYLRGFITESAEKKDVVEECFNLLMTLWTWDGSMRLRYGEYGVNWTDPDAGAVSDYGLEATYKLIADPFGIQNAAIWGNTWCSLNHYAEGETAQIADDMSQWAVTKSKMHADARKNFDESAAENNPKFLANPVTMYFAMTAQEDEDTKMVRTNVSSCVTSFTKDFITGSNNKDINRDADWKAFVDQIYELGYDEYQKISQTCYERQK